MAHLQHIVDHQRFLFVNVYLFDEILKGKLLIKMMLYTLCIYVQDLGLNSFIALDKQNYVDKALYFSENINLLEKERIKLFDQVLFSTIFNSKKFAIDFSECLYELFRKQNR